MSRFVHECMRAGYDRNWEELQRLLEGAVIRDQSTQRRINTLADAIGERVHVSPRWLREAIEAHFSGKPVPPMEIK
jgi:hypothetical protein